jgi:uncharacterized protein
MDVVLREIEPSDVDALAALVESDPAYVERVTGYPPGPADAQSLLMMRPPDLAADRKLVLGAWEGDDLVGVVDLLRGWPDEHTVHIGLLQVHGGRQGQGIGRLVHRLLLDRVRSWPETTTLRAAVVETNAAHAEPFWRASGYQPSGDPKPYTYDKLHSTVQIWTRPVAET